MSNNNKRFWKLFENVYGEPINHQISRIDVYIDTTSFENAKIFAENMFRKDNQMLMHHFKTDDDKWWVFLPSTGLHYDANNYSNCGDYRLYWFN